MCAASIYPDKYHCLGKREDMLLHLSTCQHAPRTVRLESKASLDTLKRQASKRRADARLEKQAAAKRSKRSSDEAQSSFIQVCQGGTHGSFNLRGAHFESSFIAGAFEGQAARQV